ncbi:DNA polymerase gamma [Striga asiatica]|uniref:DNA polymerase gamma n=1 Tax=Striga asiatica TaxID=4170 RepID=A0A5A7R0A6_STRAF|nr:DNA polymerase gamma [Striga asiatica]
MERWQHHVVEEIVRPFGLWPLEQWILGLRCGIRVRGIVGEHSAKANASAESVEVSLAVGGRREKDLAISGFVRFAQIKQSRKSGYHHLNHHPRHPSSPWSSSSSLSRHSFVSKTSSSRHPPLFEIPAACNFRRDCVSVSSPRPPASPSRSNSCSDLRRSLAASSDDFCSSFEQPASPAT